MEELKQKLLEAVKTANDTAKGLMMSGEGAAESAQLYRRNEKYGNAVCRYMDAHGFYGRAAEAARTALMLIQQDALYREEKLYEDKAVLALFHMMEDARQKSIEVSTAFIEALAMLKTDD